MKVLVKKVPNLVLPKKANDRDAGYDIIASSKPQIVGEFIERPIDGLKLYKRIDFIQYETNLYLAPQDNGQIVHNTEIWPRSSISKYYLTLANSIGLIDSDYRNQIFIRFKYVFQPEDCIVINESGGSRVYGILREDKIYQQGDKIAQIRGSRNQDIEFIPVDDLNQTERGLGGFGSSGL